MAEEKKSAPAKAKAPVLETVININKSGGHITDAAGESIPPGGTVKAPPAVCDKWIEAGIARYAKRSESSDA